MGIEFEAPSALYTSIIVLFIILIFLYHSRVVRQKKDLFLGLQRDNKLLCKKTSDKTYHFRYLLLIVSVLFSSVALSLPFFYVEKSSDKIKNISANTLALSENKQNTRLSKEVVFLVDTSYSMSVTDTRQGVSRLEVAKEVIDELVSRMSGEELALYAFTSEVSRIVPSTYDYLFFRLMNKQLDLNEGDIAGTDLMYTLDYLDSEHYGRFKREAQIVIMFTDGGDTRLEGLEGDRRAQELNLIISRLKTFKERGVTFYTIGLGSKKGEVIPGISHQGKSVRSSLDDELLSKLSYETHGAYYHADAQSTLHLVEKLMEKIQKIEAKKIEADQAIYQEVQGKGSLEEHFDKRYLHQVFIFIALVALVIYYFLTKESV
ncbi:MAG: VWA domain-containing protein [Chlamydiales bacterium]|nr:VWA domain-containing protein [Chlamydiales bacterium]